MNKLEKLQHMLTGYGRVAICFSGGVDSTFLLKVAVDLLGVDNVFALLADTPAMPRSEIALACSLAESIGCAFIMIQTNELDDPVYISNPVDRCYYCKQIIFGQLISAARQRGFNVVLDGNNFDDAEDYRPGHKAALEMGVESPLMNAELTKSEIRVLSSELGLTTANKPALACLATRVPTGVCITRELLKKIELAEQVLWNAGFVQVRVRDLGDTAKVEISDADFAKFTDQELRRKLVNGIKAAGYAAVMLDLTALKRN